MPADYLHNHPQFADLIRIVAKERAIAPALVEKDYWIMHCLYGLQQFGFKFELKGGTSLSKGFQIINRFSEDIDIRIEPPLDLKVKTGGTFTIGWRQRSALTASTRLSVTQRSTTRISSVAAFGSSTTALPKQWMT
jgi:hypothetical protein